MVINYILRYLDIQVGSRVGMTNHAHEIFRMFFWAIDCAKEAESRREFRESFKAAIENDLHA